MDAYFFYNSAVRAVIAPLCAERGARARARSVPGDSGGAASCSPSPAHPPALRPCPRPQEDAAGRPASICDQGSTGNLFTQYLIALYWRACAPPRTAPPRPPWPPADPLR